MIEDKLITENIIEEIKVEETNGASVGTMIVANHTLDGPNKHTIRQITGLEGRLTNLEVLKDTIRANNVGHADYYQWGEEATDTNPLGPGYFVRLGADGKIHKCTNETVILRPTDLTLDKDEQGQVIIYALAGNIATADINKYYVVGTQVPYDIYAYDGVEYVKKSAYSYDGEKVVKICHTTDALGVTVSSAGFVGNDENITGTYTSAKAADPSRYALVATTGVVDVLCDHSILVGDYVFPTVGGWAAKSTGSYGYLVTALVPDANETLYARIVLSQSIVNTKRVSDNVDYLLAETKRIDGNITTFGNTAEAALKRAEELTEAAQQSANTSSQNAQDATNAAVNAQNSATNAWNVAQQVSPIAQKAAEDAKAAQGAALTIKDDAIASANETAAQIATDMSNATLNTIKALEYRLDECTVGQYSQAYGLTFAQAKAILPLGTAFIPMDEDPTASDARQEYEEVYAGGEEADVKQTFTVGYAYKWTANGWLVDTTVLITRTPTEQSDGDYWFVVKEYDGDAYKCGSLYRWENDTWKEVAIRKENVMSRTMAHLYQSDDTIRQSVSSVDGKVAAVETKVAATEARSGLVASVPTELVGVKPANYNSDKETIDIINDKADLDANWTEHAQAHANGTYYYVVGTQLPYDVYACVVKDGSATFAKSSIITYDGVNFYKANVAGIFATANEEGSSVQLNADKLNFRGVAAFTCDENGGITQIKGGCIETGSITANQIASKTITADQIDVDTITIDVAKVTGQFDASRIVVGENNKPILVNTQVWFAQADKPELTAAEREALDWQVNGVDWEENTFIWQKTTYTYGAETTLPDNSIGTTYTEYVCITGAKGPTGDPAKVIKLATSAQVFSVDKDDNISPASITIIGQVENTTITGWSYRTDDAADFTEVVPAGVTLSDGVITVVGSDMTAKSITIKASDDDARSDVVTITKVFDGAEGTAAYNVILSNESHTFAGDVDSAITASTECFVRAYYGSTSVAATIGEITNCPTGMTATINNNNSTDASFTISVTTEMVSSSGSLIIPVTVGGVEFIKQFSYALALRGNPGDGSELDIEVKDQYIVSTSDTSISPTIENGNSWTEFPKTVDGTTIYFFEDNDWLTTTTETIDGTSVTTSTAKYVWKRTKTTVVGKEPQYTTPYCISFTDTARIAAAAIGMEIGEWCEERGLTIIAGSTIATGKIMADEIDANGIKAENVDISGMITATKGFIGGWNIEGDRVGSDVVGMYSGTEETKQYNSLIEKPAIRERELTKYFTPTPNSSATYTIPDLYSVQSIINFEYTKPNSLGVNYLYAQVENNQIVLYYNVYGYGSINYTVQYTYISDEMEVSGTSYMRFYAGADKTQPSFLVLEDGSLYAGAANITGTINTNKGHIGELEIADGGLIHPNYSLNQSGLTLTSPDAKIAVGNVELKYDDTNTVLKTSNAFSIAGENDTQITLMDDGGEQDVSGTIYLDYQRDKYIPSFTVKAHLQYACIYSFTYEVEYQHAVEDKATNTKTIIKRGRYKFVFDKGSTESSNTIVETSGSANDAIDYIRFYNIAWNDWDIWLDFIPDRSDEDFISLDEGYTFKQVAKNNYIKIQGHLIPRENSTDEATGFNMGLATNQWNHAYARVGHFQQLHSVDPVLNPSDQNIKNTINDLSNDYSLLFDKLRPVTFKYNDGTSHRLHTGFIAQEVKQAVEDVGLTTQDFAAYCEWEKEDGATTCGLRYTEFIALCINEIQKLKKRVAELEEEKNK